MQRLFHLAAHPRRTLQFALACGDKAKSTPILSASIGRVGSTLTWQALVRSRARDLLGSYQGIDWRIISDTCWDLEDYQPRRGRVCKTHDFPDRLGVRQDLKIVFLFGPPSDAALSVYRCMTSEGPAWIADHFRHMHANGAFEDLLKRDVLRMEEQIDAWHHVSRHSVLCLNYTALWDNVDILSEYVGFRVELPQRRDRGFDDIDPALRDLAKATYAKVDAKVANLPSYTIIRRAR